MDGDKKRPKVGVGAVVIKEGKILLGKRKGTVGNGEWAISGGHLEFGESVEECAVRELAEETGLKALSWELGPWTNNMLDGSKHYVTLFVFITCFEGNPQLLEPAKCEGWEWFELDKLPSPLFPTVQFLIEKVGIEKLQEASYKITGSVEPNKKQAKAVISVR